MKYRNIKDDLDDSKSWYSIWHNAVDKLICWDIWQKVNSDVNLRFLRFERVNYEI